MWNIAKKGLTLVEFLVIAAIFTMIVGILFNMLTSLSKQSKKSEKITLFERDAAIFFDYLKADLRSVHRAEYSKNRLSLFVTRLVSDKTPEEMGINYQWNQKQIFRTPEYGKSSTVNFIAFRDEGSLNLAIEKKFNDNYEVKLEAFDSEGVSWAEQKVVVQILSFSMND